MYSIDSLSTTTFSSKTISSSEFIVDAFVTANSYSKPEHPPPRTPIRRTSSGSRTALSRVRHRSLRTRREDGVEVLLSVFGLVSPELDLSEASSVLLASSLAVKTDDECNDNNETFRITR